MSLIDFWTNIKTASGFISPQVEVDSKELNANDLQQIIASAVIWLTPRSVQGFDIDDFSFLSQKERENLAESVRQFKEVTENIPEDQPATKEKIIQSKIELQKMINILQTNRYEKAEYYKVAKLLDSLKPKLPEWIDAIKYQFDFDSAGEPAVWIWIIAKDDEAEKESFFKNVRETHSIISSTLQMHGITLWPYPGVRTVTEQQEMEAGTYNELA